MLERWPTPFTALVGCRVPLQLAGMGGVSTAALAGAVARAGGLGMLGGAGLPATEILARLGAARERGGHGAAIGVNFLVPFVDERVVEEVAAVAPVVEFFYGDPTPALVTRAAASGAVVAWQVGSAAEAVAAVDAGCRFVVAQGVEAGGHVRGVTPSLALLDEVRAGVDVPVVAAGGMGSGRAVARALRAGADGVRVGTRLLATDEADVHPAYLEALVAGTADDTVVTESFAMGWPSAPHRVLRSCVEASTADPAQRSPLPPTRDFGGDVGSAALYAGTSVGEVTGSASAAEVVAELIEDAAAVLGRR